VSVSLHHGGSVTERTVFIAEPDGHPALTIHTGRYTGDLEVTLS